MPRLRRAASVVPLLAAVALAGCAARPKAPVTAASQMLDDARRGGLELDDPMALDPSVLAEVDRGARSTGTLDARIDQLLRYLDFRYEPNHSAPARRAFYERRGDCMTFALLVTALARHLGMPAYFLHVREVQARFERKGWFFVSSHVAVGLGTGPNAEVIDFLRDRGGVDATDWRLAEYDAIDDATAIALYYNNVAVAELVAGDAAASARLLSFLVRERPTEELYANLGVALSRQGAYADSLSVLEEGIRRFPAYEPLYTNALHAATAAKRPDVADALASAGERVAHRDPFFLFARALTYYQTGSYVLAAHELERATAERPESVVLLAWLTRAYLSAGDVRRGLEAFTRMRRADPDARVARELAEQFPALRTEL